MAHQVSPVVQALLGELLVLIVKMESKVQNVLVLN